MLHKIHIQVPAMSSSNLSRLEGGGVEGRQVGVARLHGGRDDGDGLAAALQLPAPGHLRGRLLGSFLGMIDKRWWLWMDAYEITST